MNENYIRSSNLNNIISKYTEKSIVYYKIKNTKEKFISALKNTKQTMKEKITDKTISFQNSLDQKKLELKSESIIEEQNINSHQYFKRSRENFKKLKLYYKIKKSQAVTKKNNLVQSLYNKYDRYYELKTYKKEMKVLAKRGLLLSLGLSYLIFFYSKFYNRTRITFFSFFLLSSFTFVTTNILIQRWLNSNYKDALNELMRKN
jgi:hypothetical protein